MKGVCKSYLGNKDQKNNFPKCFSIGRALSFCARVFYLLIERASKNALQIRHVKNGRTKPKCASDRETTGKIVFYTIFEKLVGNT